MSVLKRIYLQEPYLTLHALSGYTLFYEKIVSSYFIYSVSFNKTRIFTKNMSKKECFKMNKKGFMGPFMPFAAKRNLRNICIFIILLFKQSFDKIRCLRKSGIFMYS